MVRLVSLTRREVSRFMKIPRQTLGAPLLETFLYISVFGAALGSRVGDLDGYSYVVFVIPGLIMMAFAINAFTNNASSILQQKFQRAIDDQLSSPASPGQRRNRWCSRSSNVQHQPVACWPVRYCHHWP